MDRKEPGTQQQKRGRYGDGSIFQRKDGRWEGRYYVDGKRRSVYAAKKSEVRSKLKELQRKAEIGEVVASSRMTTEQYLLSWLDMHKLEVRESTAQNYGYMVHAHMLPAFGHVQLQKLRADHVQGLINGLLDADLEASTIHQIVMVLNMALKAAVQKRLLALNPCMAATLPRIAKKEKHILTAGQAQALIQAAQGTMLEGIVILALATGMRCGEILGLKWGDIDFEAGRITVSRTLIYINGRGFYLHEPKSKRGRRIIPLAAFAIDALKIHHTRQLEARMASGVRQHPEMVFTGHNGEYLRYRLVRAHFDKLVAELLGFGEVTLHSLRHSAATLLLSMKVPAHVVQQILGHSDIATTLGEYGHVLDGQKEGAIESLNMLLSQPKKEAK